MTDLLKMEKLLITISNDIKEEIEKTGDCKVENNVFILSVEDEKSYSEALYLKGCWDVTNSLLEFVSKKIDKRIDMMENKRRENYS